MTTAIDSNVIVAFWYPEEALNAAAKAALLSAEAHGALIISATVYAELLAAPLRDEHFLDAFCSDSGIVVDWNITEEIWRVAGRAFRFYSARRKRSRATAPRRILADFLIGAHAQVNGYRLLTLDAGLYRAAFPRLSVIVI
jgi:hypothetical protein